MSDVFKAFLGGTGSGERDMTDIEEYEEEDYESDLKKELLAKRELKSCPFCGNDVEVKRYKANGNDWWYVACNHCMISVDPLFWNVDRTKKEITEIWNRRAVHED